MKSEEVFKAPQPVSMNKSVGKLEDVVKDLNEVMKTLAANASLEELEQKLKEYWREESRMETLQNVATENSEKITSETDTVDLKSIEQQLEEYWGESAEEKEAPQSKNRVLSIESISNVTDVADLGEAKQIIENYRRYLAGGGAIENYIQERSVKSISEATDIAKLEKHELRETKYRGEIVKVDAEGNEAKSKPAFGRHPSKKLNDLYAIKSYQGANPVDARVIFVGRDPNWAADIEDSKMFEFVVDYLTDGISFWEKRNVHHPFLLKGYKGDGSRYHKKFSKLNLDSSVASKVSFVELIGFPTTGMARNNNTLFKEFLFSSENRDNLILLDKVLNDSSKNIFIAWGLIDNFVQIYDKTGLFKKFAALDKSTMNRKQLNKIDNVYIHTHFSDSISNITLLEMEIELMQYIL